MNANIAHRIPKAVAKDNTIELIENYSFGKEIRIALAMDPKSRSTIPATRKQVIGFADEQRAWVGITQNDG